MIKNRLIVFLIIIITIYYQTSVEAGNEILLNGSFSDWTDKPLLEDPLNDESSALDIVEVRWFPDNITGELYFYTERRSSSFFNWNYILYLEGDLGVRRVDITYLPDSKRENTIINIYDSNNRLIWQARGKWGDNKNPGTRLEFFIPLNLLVSTINGGYEISARFSSRNDSVPDYGSITISSVSSAPALLTAGLILVSLGYILISRKNRKIK